jgi:phage terminase large subunit
MQIKRVKQTKVFKKNLQEYQDKAHRIVINEGGTGSSKTYSLAQLFARILCEADGVQITIARKTFPALRATAMRDFFSVLKDWGVYDEALHNKSENIYRNKGNEVDFVSLDEPTKVRSRRRHYLWMNEANEFLHDDFEQLNMRTSEQIFMDYNPSHLYHWIYDKLQTRKDCIVIPSTYKDNPFLAPELVKEIESYQGKDKNYWRIYGLGLKGIVEAIIYSHWKYCDALPESPDNTFYGLDFGYNNQTAFVRIDEKDKNYYWEELLYERYLTNQDLIRSEEEATSTGKKLGILHQFVKDGKLTYSSPIYADASEPARIKEIKDAGFNIIAAFKTDIKNGIDIIKSRGFFITKESVNILKEVKSYCWREKDGKLLDEPVKQNDHLLDGGRYAIITSTKVVQPKLTWF